MVLSLLLLLTLAAFYLYSLRGLLGRAEVEVGPGEPDRDFPGRDRPFATIDLLRSPELQAGVEPHHVTEAAEHHPPEFQDGLLLIDRPEEVPAGWSEDVRGLGLAQGKLRGDFAARLSLDLRRSRLSRTLRAGRSATSLHLTLQTLWGQGSEAWFSARFAPATPRYPGGVVWATHTAGLENPRAVPAGARRLRFELRRSRGRLAAYAAFDDDALFRLAEWRTRELNGPVRHVSAYAEAVRPAGEPEGRAYKVPGSDRYVVDAFTFQCTDPAGCMVRVRERSAP